LNDIAQPQLIRDDWENESIYVMLKALRAKFSQNDHLKKILLSTDGTWLIEHTENDRKWGDGKNGSGTNYLGKLLILVRQELLDEKQYDPDLPFLKLPMDTLLKY